MYGQDVAGGRSDSGASCDLLKVSTVGVTDWFTVEPVIGPLSPVGVSPNSYIGVISTGRGAPTVAPGSMVRQISMGKSGPPSTTEPTG